MTFTDLYVKNLKPADKKYMRTEGKGFSIQVYPNGTKTFYLRYSFEGKQKLLALGHYPHIPISEARKKYNEAMTQVLSGIDPATPPPIPIPLPTEKSVADACNDYIEWSQKHHAASWAYIVEKALKKHIIPVIGGLPINAIGRKDAIKLIADIEGSGAARTTYKIVRGVFQNAVDLEYIMASPFTQLARPIPSIGQSERNRVLTPSELKILWPFLLQGYGTEEVRNAIRMVLITAQRPGEVIGMRTDEIEEDWDGDKWWTIPGDRTKNGNTHMVYLSPMALELVGNKKGYVFALDGGAEPLERAAMSHLVAKKTLGKEPYYGLPRWTPHDLRRTARTNFSRMGVPLPVAEAILNHAKEGMVKVYDLHEYKDEKKKAMLMWDRELRKLFG